MVTKKQVRRLFKIMSREKNLTKASLLSGMDVKTGRKYARSGMLPGEMKKKHTWVTRKDPFKDVWCKIEPYLQTNPRIEAKTLFGYLAKEYPDKYQSGQLRTLQRKIKQWRAIEGPPKEVFFPQIHYPGILSASDFTHMDSLEITINKVKFNHLLYHFVLTYSNWETASICFSESLESLSEGLQKALWELGGVPLKHRTDRLSAAVNKDCSREELTSGYKALLDHYGIAGTATNANSGHENGDVEQSHYRFKKAVDQALMLRGNRNFESRSKYEEFLKELTQERNKDKGKRFNEEIKLLKRLPMDKINNKKAFSLKVGKSSTINVMHNTYSVNSRLIGERIEIKVNAETLEVWYGQRQVDTLPRLRGESKSVINYRHIIDWLKRKPGAFEEYRFRDDLFPSTTFRIVYDFLKKKYPDTGNKRYIDILNLADKETETGVEKALKYLLEKDIEPGCENIKQILDSKDNRINIIEPEISRVNLLEYDNMLCAGGVK